jgi:hypothetical protein
VTGGGSPPVLFKEEIMADRVPASIELGGSLGAADYAELVVAIQAEGLSVEWGGEPFEADHRTEGEMLRLHAFEVAGGAFETLENHCIEKGLPFVRWCGGYGCEWGAERVVFDGEGEPRHYAADEDDQVVIGREEAMQLGSFEAISGYFEAADFKVPPLIVEG